MKNKKLLIAGASAASLAALGFGAFAFFTDTVEITKDTKIGNIELTVDAEMTHTQLTRSNVLRFPDNIYDGFIPPIYPDWSRSMPVMMAEDLTKTDLEAMFEEAPDNINPGDNLETNIGAPGTDHEIVINVTNEGSKSVQTRIIFEISGKTADGVARTENQLNHLKIYLDSMNSMPGLTSAGKSPQFIPSDIFDSRTELEQISNDGENKVVYALTPYDVWDIPDFTETEFGQVYLGDYSPYANNSLILSGNSKHNNAEIEKFPKISLKDKYSEDGVHLNDYEETTTIENIPSIGSLKFDISLDNGLYYNQNSYSFEIDEEAMEEIAILQGAEIEIKVIVQGIQLRNSDPDMWRTLFEQSFLV